MKTQTISNPNQNPRSRTGGQQFEFAGRIAQIAPASPPDARRAPSHRTAARALASPFRLPSHLKARSARGSFVPATAGPFVPPPLRFGAARIGHSLFSREHTPFIAGRSRQSSLNQIKPPAPGLSEPSPPPASGRTASSRNPDQGELSQIKPGKSGASRGFWSASA
jgi:hypothetical protein